MAVDIRRESPSHGRWASYRLSAENGSQPYIQVGLAHSFPTLVLDSEVMYKCGDHDEPETEGALRWDDADIGEWPIAGAAVLSAQNASAPLLAYFNSPFTFEG